MKLEVEIDEDLLRVMREVLELARQAGDKYADEENGGLSSLAHDIIDDRAEDWHEILTRQDESSSTPE